MARRRTSRKKPTRRRAKRGFNVVNAAELYLTTNVLTKSMFGATPLEFVTGRTSGFGLSGPGGEMPDYLLNTYRPASDGTIMTLPEILGINAANTTVAFGTNDPILPQIQNNLANFGGIGNVVAQTFLLKVGFTVGKKLLRKQRTVLNDGIKMMGLKGTVSV